MYLFMGTLFSVFLFSCNKEIDTEPEMSEVVISNCTAIGTCHDA